MNCLNCNTEMTNNLVETKNDEISYDMCEACGSLWLDSGELDKIANQVTGSIEFCSTDKVEANSEKTKSCPRCGDMALEKVSFLGDDDIILDHCKNCLGFWLDSNELTLINKDLEKIMPIQGKGFSEFIKNVHVPYWHKRIKRKSSETDFKNEVLPIKGAELKSSTSHVCPSCNSRLDLYKIFGIEVDGCQTCKGIWLDKDELRKLKDSAENDPWTTLRWMDDELEAIEMAQALPSKRLCPKCDGEKLVSTTFGDSHIILDYCPSCHGTWLDRDEYHGIVCFLTKKMNGLTPEEAKGKVFEEIKEIWTGPENVASEILDAKAAISAFINILIYENPTLSNIFLKLRERGRSIGL
jgi:uncharacterized protein